MQLLLVTQNEKYLSRSHSQFPTFLKLNEEKVFIILLKNFFPFYPIDNDLSRASKRLIENHWTVFAHYLPWDRKFYSSYFPARNNIKKLIASENSRDTQLLRKICVYFVCRSSLLFLLYPSPIRKKGSGRIQVSSASKEAHFSNVACYNLRDFPFFSRPLY